MLKIMRNRKGVALMSSLFFLIIVTVLASAAILLSTVQMKVASSVAVWESGLAVAEGAVNYVLPLLQYVHFESTIPNPYCADLGTASPCSMSVAGLSLINELQTTTDYKDADVPGKLEENLHISPSANRFDGMDVGIDIDAVGSSVMAGGGIEASWAYHGGAYSSSLVKAYRVSVTAATPSGSSRARINQILWLRAIM
jgi:hypothetical protein